MTSQLDGAGSPEVETEGKPSKPDAASAQSSARRSDARRHERVATVAYYLAANRGFEPGHEDEDWSLAELQTDAIDAGRKS